MEGASFQIIAAENIYTQEVTQDLFLLYQADMKEYLIHKKGDVVTTINTDRYGWAYATNLYIGKYKIMETIAGDGFVLNQEVKEFEITPQEQTINFDIQSVQYKNERQRLQIEVQKKDKENEMPLYGAVFGLYVTEDIYTNIVYDPVSGKWIIRDVPVVTVSAGTFIKACVTGIDGKGIFAGELPLGKYEIKELTPPTGYLPTEETVLVDASYEGSHGGQFVQIQRHVGIFHNERSDKPTPAGKYFEYTFTGTGIEVYAQKHANFASYDVSIDGGKAENVSLAGSGGGDPQQKIFEAKNLENKQHTIRCTIVARDGKTQANLDYLKIFAPVQATEVNKADLQTAIESGAGLIEGAYDADKWEAFKEAYKVAVEVMNNADADQDAVEKAAAALNAAMEALGDPNVPEIGEVQGEAVHVESSAVILEWGQVKGAASYLVKWNDQEVKTSDTRIRIEGLESGVTYDFNIFALNTKDVPSENAIEIHGITTTDVVKPGVVTEIKATPVDEDSAKLTWTAPADTDVASYNIYQNGVKIGDSKNTEFTMDKLEVGTVYEVRITAVDNAGNESIPAPFKFTFTEPEKENFTLKAAANAEEMGIVSVEPQQDSYEAGTEVTVKAEAKEGFRFVNWTKTGTEEEVSTEAAYKFAITENTDLTANFVKEEVPEEIFHVTIKANDNTMGTVTIDSADGSYKKGEKAEVIAVANEGFRFVNWTDAEGVAVSDSNPYVFEVTKDLDLIANFEKIPAEKYTFSVAANDEKMGSVAVEPQQDTYEAGTEIKVSAVPASEDYEFVGFTNIPVDELLKAEQA